MFVLYASGVSAAQICALIMINIVMDTHHHHYCHSRCHLHQRHRHLLHYCRRCRHEKGTNSLYKFNSVQFSSRWYLCAPKAHIRFIPSLTGFTNVAFETVPMFVWLTMALFRPFKEDRLSTPLTSRRLVVYALYTILPLFFFSFFFSFF